MKVTRFLRIESAALLALSFYAYYSIEGSLTLFLILILVPDISMIGYLRNNDIGALTYNVFHNYGFAVILLFIGFFNDVFIPISLIWFIHISADRVMGLGLKKDTFQETHLD